MYENLLALCDTIGVSGKEENITAAILKMVPSKTEYNIDSVGNLYISQTKANILLVAHMDEVGIMIKKHISDNLFEFSVLGHIDSDILESMPMRFENGIKGKILSWENQKIVSIEDKNYNIKIGDTASFDTVSKIYDSKIIGKALDNRVGCYILLELLQDYDNIDVIFTVQEEIGLIGAEAIQIKKNYNYIIDIDCIAENDANKDVIQQNGPILVLKDGLVVYNYHILEQFESIAQHKSIPYQIFVSDNGGLEASTLFIKNQKVGSICVPIKYSHSYKQTTEIEDIEMTINLIKNIISLSTQKNGFIIDLFDNR